MAKDETPRANNETPAKPDEMTPVCEKLIRHLETLGSEMFEKNFVKDGEILCTVFAIVGPRAAEMTALVREWAQREGMHRDN